MSVSAIGHSSTAVHVQTVKPQVVAPKPLPVPAPKPTPHTGVDKTV